MRVLLYMQAISVSVLLVSPAVGVEPDPNNPRVTPVVLAYRKARPAVVNISSTTVVRTYGLFGPGAMDRMFPDPFRRNVEVQSLGSGVLIHPAGYIVTNAHVVQRARKIEVTLADDTRFAARVIATEPSRDLAVLKIDPRRDANKQLKPLPYLPLGRSDDLMVGETVIAIGNPGGLSNTLTQGIISATDRKLEFRGGGKYEGLIQTDTPINPGNSGGPLLNIKGEFIGINTAVRADAQNIGFAIPVDALGREFPNLLDYERLNRVVLGIEVETRRNGKTGESHVVVSTVRKDSPADKAGLRKGDRLIGIDELEVKQITDFVCEMIVRKPGEKVSLKVRRDGRTLPVDVTLAAKPKPDVNQLARKHFGLTLRQVTPRLAKDLDLPLDAGLLVTGVEEGGPADRLGIHLKDVIFQVGRLYVKKPSEIATMLEDLQPGDRIRVGLARGNVAAWVVLPARRKSH
ncbi:MAG: trypsin-like peptidase domain-containing protein [Phycisphaerae bacterium]